MEKFIKHIGTGVPLRRSNVDTDQIIPAVYLKRVTRSGFEDGESPEQAAIREVAEETGIKSEITRSLGVIDFWFMASGKRIHKTVHHYLFTEVGGKLAPQVTEVDDVAWFPLEEIVSKLAYPDERKLIAKSGQLSP